MADTTKPTPELPVAADAAPAVLPVVPVEQPKAVESSEPVTQAPATTEVAAAPAPGVESSAAPAVEESKEEAKKEDVKPVEEGALEVKGTSFPKNLFYSKNYFWFGNEAVETKSLTNYIKTEKVAGSAHNAAAWASETGKGLLFFGEKQGDKSSIQGAIELAEASEPTNDGPQKFNLATKAHRHTFKAANTAERDNWVAQLKLKIAEAKELAPTVKESENYKKTVESFKPKSVTAAHKEEQKVDAPTATEVIKPEESAAVVAPTEETSKTDELAPKKEDKERRSASRKRGSIFGSLLNKPKEEKAKHDEKKEEKKEEKSEVKSDGAVTEPIVPTTEAPVAVETAGVPVEPVPALVDSTSPAQETSTSENKTDSAKPAPTKRTSIFGVFGKKEKKAADSESSPIVPAKDAPVEVSETAPVIPAVETSAPLTTEVAAAAPVTTAEPTAEVPAVTNGESKKEVKNDKRKSSLPFNFGGNKKATSDSEGEGKEGRSKSPSAFSRLRSTIKGKPKESKPVEKSEEKPVEADASKDVVAETEPMVKTEDPKPSTVEDVPATKPVAATPVVAASA